MREASRDGGHLWGIDVIRFVAAVLVAFFHLTWQEPSVAGIAWYGWVGVQIFFVISGVVIARSADDTTPMRFMQSRILRLYPAAWVCAVISLLFALSVYGWDPVFAARFVGSFLLCSPFLASAYWTLPIEIAFYGLIFFVLMAGSFSRMERLAAALSIASTAYVIAYALQVAGLFSGPNLDLGYGWKNMTLLRHGIYFAAGIFISLWASGRLTRIGTAAFALAAAAAPLEIACRTAELVPKARTHVDSLAEWTVPVTVWGIALGAIILSALWERAIKPPPAFFAAARAIGLATYPLYLLHEQVGTAVRDVLIGGDVPLLSAVAAAVAGTSLLALGIALLLEPPLRDLTRCWLASLGEAAEDVPWLGRLFRYGGTI